MQSRDPYLNTTSIMAAQENYDISTSRLTGVRSASELLSNISFEGDNTRSLTFLSPSTLQIYYIKNFLILQEAIFLWLLY